MKFLFCTNKLAGSNKGSLSSLIQVSSQQSRASSEQNMRGVFSFFLVAVFLLLSARTYANKLQSNTTTAKCKPHPPSGMPGMNGIPGIPGAPGSPGRDGFKGEKGTNGNRGLEGATGIPGKIGPRGPEGAKGENGTGIQGNTGPRGLKGPKGENGRKGQSGIGTKGEKGDAANIDPRQLANWKQCVWNTPSSTDSGKIKECSFNKLHSNTALKVSYQGNIRVYGDDVCNRWFFKFNGNECSGPMTIESILYINWRRNHSSKPYDFRPHSFEGYCENLARGTISVELWVGKCSGNTLGDAHTGWNSVSCIMIEEVPPSQ